MSDEEFNKSTPVKLGNLWETHCKMEGLTEGEDNKHEKANIDDLWYLS